MQVGQVPESLVQIEPVADEELVGHRETHVAHRKLVHEAAVRSVEERGDRQRGRVAEAQRPAEVVEREAGVDDVLDDQDVAAGDGRVEVLEQPDLGMAAGGRSRVPRQLE